jgi:SAM-dependent methyltransferase
MGQLQIKKLYYMNKYIKKTSIELQYPKQFSQFKENGYSSLNPDGLLKWASVLDNIETYKSLDNLNILDVGGGYSAITFLLSKNNNIINIDLNRNDNWFSTNPDGTIPGLKSGSYNLDNIKFIECNFLTESQTLPDNYFDVIIDSCSIIHFNPTLDKHINQGLYDSSIIINQKLKKDGIFVVSSDLAKPTEDSNNEFLHPHIFIDIVKDAGFELIGDSNFGDIDNLFDVKGILSIGTFVFAPIK